MNNIVSISKIMDFINNIEEKFPVDKWVIDNVHVWPLIRIKICAMAVTTVNAPKKTKNKKSQEINNNKYLSEMEKYYKSDEWTKKKVDAVFLGRTAVRTRVNDLWYSKFCDYLIDQCSEMSLDTLYLEYCTSSSGYRYPVYRPIVPIQKYLKMFARKNSNHNSMKYDLEGYSKFLQCLNDFYKETGYKAFNCSVRDIMYRVKIIRRLAGFFKTIFAKTKPKVGFVVCYYNDYGFAFNLACKECGILSVDIQHGVQEDLHYAYGRWNKTPNCGYELLPSFFWNWNKESSNVIEKWNKECKMWHDAVIGGNPWIDMCERDSGKLLTNENSKILSVMGKEKDTVNILYTHTSKIPLSELILKTIESSPPNWKWWIRLHPCASEELCEKDIQILKKCNNNNIEWKLATELPLLAWLNQVNVHVTINSSCVKEAAVFGVPSIMIGADELCNQYYHREIHSGLAVIAHEIDEVISYIKNYVNTKENKQKEFYDNSNARKALKILFNIDEEKMS